MQYSHSSDKVNAEINTAIAELQAKLITDYPVKVEPATWGIVINDTFVIFDVTLEATGSSSFWSRQTGKWRIYIGQTSTQRHGPRRKYVRVKADGTVDVKKFAEKVMEAYYKQTKQDATQESMKVNALDSNAFISEMRESHDWRYTSILTTGPAGNLRIQADVNKELAIKILDLFVEHNGK